jgi:hypothetical protein
MKEAERKITVMKILNFLYDLNFKYIIKILNSSIHSFKTYLLFSNNHPNFFSPENPF